MLISTVGGSSVALVAPIVSHYLNNVLKDRDFRKYVAVKVASSLEGYSVHCASLLADDEVCIGSDGHAGTAMTGIPIPGDLPEDDHWHIFGSGTAEKLVNFPQVVEASKREVSTFWDQVGDHDDMERYVRQNTAELALDALAVASEIRTNFGLPARNMIIRNWDITSYLHKVKTGG